MQYQTIGHKLAEDEKVSVVNVNANGGKRHTWFRAINCLRRLEDVCAYMYVCMHMQLFTIYSNFV